MIRVPARLVLQLLRDEADKRDKLGQPGDGDEFRITGGALRNWVWRGHITRGPGGYDLEEITEYLERRATTGRDQSARQLDARSGEM